jgi:site-specific DNA-methyltransferase (adenine-specific)
MGNAQIHPTLEKLIVPVSELKHYGRNPRRGDLDVIADSLTRNGQYKPIVVRAGTNEVLAGNQTLMAARDKLGWDQIAATFVDVDDDAAARIVLVDNRTSDLASYDTPELLELLNSVPDLAGTGFDAAALESLYGTQEPAEAPADADEVPEAPAPITKPGDVWLLGEHRVICGDATDPVAYRTLLGDERPDCLWTDPPYGVEYVGKTKDALRIQNDGAAGLGALLADAFPAAREFLRPGAPLYVAHADTERATVEGAFRGAGFLFRQNLVWVKNTMVLGRSDYHYQHEPILYGETPEPEPHHAEAHEPVLYGFAPGAEGRLGRGGPRWYGPDNATTVFFFDKPAASREHPTMKPVALILAMFANSVRPGQIVLDCFGGSGSTLIAADVHGAKARLIELDPRYVDVICARYQKSTGQPPARPDGTPVDFLIPEVV